MKTMRDARVIENLAAQQRGVFSKHDLQTALAEKHPAAFVRRVRAMEREGVLCRFMRGWYVTGSFDLAVLSQRIAPRSYISFGSVLARELLVGTCPARQVMAVKVGHPCRYAALGYEIVHLGGDPRRQFGVEVVDGVRYANAEKAVIDVLYYHLHGQHYVFDIYSDVRLGTLKVRRLREYLHHYDNPKFIAFAEAYLGLR